ncbi:MULTISPECIES: glycogen debranching protein [Fusobacterium]|jgi:isoamylase|uniref:Glycogen-debranching protein n=1 Tax=Fusobacterium varium ATCC 27725 TaxID=469618 RepID=A0ABN5JDG0_FUSVA|nr:MULTISPECIES: isoamylase [Fusobacterium]AVQ30022.1 glycogen-debranching protein [Fusobacterium varium ATCC 27725]EES64957.1 putative glycogen debranching enzyme GlgX [Fusobacterium varium ATCC 27725]MCF0170756.1 glycogen-debranching protein [Fusobacterium varium]OFL91418.1 glycogen debranching enzyme [Fusobacterium sp. HMSC073F01]UYI78422.1 MAG: isoamylase [Fusobacterium varium]
MCVWEAGVPKLGVTIESEGINFAIFAKNKKKVVLNIYSSGSDVAPKKSFILDPTINKTGNIWHIFLKETSTKTLYTWKLDDSPELLDPYALSYTNNKNYSRRKSIAVKKDYVRTKHLNTELENTIIYEVHIKLFTQNFNSMVKFPGTYGGFIEKIPYLKELGITAVEFLPVYEWDDFTGNTGMTNGAKLKNIWGYNPIGFFAPTKKFSKNQTLDSDSEIVEFKELVKNLHDHGIEVILDVVYNHTAEGGNGGKIYNFKAMDNKTFYMLENNDTQYKNYSGCGNTFNCNNKVVKDIIVDSLRYWYLEMGVDGFRFDLASVLGRGEDGQWSEVSLLNELVQDPILSHCKLISESWDLGGYYVGDMPAGWSEWNGKYRDVVRKFIKGEFGLIPELLKRIFGSPDIFKRNNRGPMSNINFVTCHDGFTMWDLVSYNNKHNLNNGENNNDGENNNNSYNYGIEGGTDDPAILEIRKRQIKNMFLILFISQGVPMLLMGDEMGRTQFGNNNAYCQNNRSTWLDWERGAKFYEITNFVKNMIKIRKKYSIFRRKNYLELSECEDCDVSLHGVKLNSPDYSYYSLSIAFVLHDTETDTSFYIALNSYHEELAFELPILQNKKWYLLVDTSKPEKENFREDTEALFEKKYLVQPRSSIILISK